MSLHFLSVPGAPYIAGTMCTKACVPLFPGRGSAPLHPLDGRETVIPPAEQARSAKRRRCGMQFPRRTRTAKPQAQAKRAARRRCADPYHLQFRDKRKPHPGDIGMRSAILFSLLCSKRFTKASDSECFFVAPVSRVPAAFPVQAFCVRINTFQEIRKACRWALRAHACREGWR